MPKPIEVNRLRDGDDIPTVPICRSVTGGEQKVRRRFNPKWEYGLGTEMRSRTDKKAIQFLHDSAKATLPKGTPYQLRMEDSNEMLSFERKVPTKRRIRACWYYCPLFQGGAEENISTERWRYFKIKNVSIRGMYYS